MITLNTLNTMLYINVYENRYNIIYLDLKFSIPPNANAHGLTIVVIRCRRRTHIIISAYAYTILSSSQNHNICMFKTFFEITHWVYRYEIIIITRGISHARPFICCIILNYILLNNITKLYRAELELCTEYLEFKHDGIL